MFLIHFNLEQYFFQAQNSRVYLFKTEAIALHRGPADSDVTPVTLSTDVLKTVPASLADFPLYLISVCSTLNMMCLDCSYLFIYSAWNLLSFLNLWATSFTIFGVLFPMFPLPFVNFITRLSEDRTLSWCLQGLLPSGLCALTEQFVVCLSLSLYLCLFLCLCLCLSRFSLSYRLASNVHALAVASE